MPFYACFVDLTKAFDTVSRDSLYEVLKAIGCPPILLSLVASFHDGMRAKVQFDGGLSDEFQINIGVKQGCVLAPTLFGIYLAALLELAFSQTGEGIFIRTRIDRSLFNLARLKA